MSTRVKFEIERAVGMCLVWDQAMIVQWSSEQVPHVDFGMATALVTKQLE